MIAGLFLQAYLCIFISVLCHEGAHAITARYIALPINKIEIGEELFSIHIGHISISPLLSWGTKITFPSEKLYEKGTGKIIVFFLSGPVSNVANAIIGGVLSAFGSSIGMTFFAVNVSFFLINIIPLRFLSNDGYKALRYLKDIHTQNTGT